MRFDEVLIQIGEFGTYQKRLYLLLCLPAVNSGIFMTMSVFLLGVPNHRCTLPGKINDTYAVQDVDHQHLINQTIPDSSDEDFLYDDCHVFPENVSYDINHRPINASVFECNEWVYEDTVFKSTFVSEVDLVCDKEIMPSVAKMIFFAGVLVGSLGFGVLSDIYGNLHNLEWQGNFIAKYGKLSCIGRKKTLCVSVILALGTSIGLAWIDTFAAFVILRFLVGAGNAGIFMTAYVIGMEIVGPSKRLWPGVINNYFFATGMLLLAGFSFALRDWRHIEMVAAFPNAIYLSYWWLIPESPRWLLSQGRVEEAEAIIRHAAKVNNATLPEKIFDADAGDSGGPQGRLWHLFSSKTLAIRTLVIFFNWMVVSMTYYGLSLNAGNLGGNFYLNFTLTGLVEFPAYTLCIILLNRTGRKWLHFSSMVLGGVACISTVFTTTYGGDDYHALTVTLAMVGKVGAAAAFAVIYIFSAELFPTSVRNAGMGASSCCARVGGMVAPYIADLNKVVSGDFGRALPLLVFGGFCVAAGVLSLALPETLGKQLPETIEDGKHFAHAPAKSKEVYVNNGFALEDKMAATKESRDDMADERVDVKF